ncbi:hypothetical protein Q8A67_017362 [Cirrhinus molitorella]|uniref:Uncharacterized protein n=1 Tax=Cirrhinus molitorella TaxID=172907 RepID=A0AA88PHT4_9TELE|nr:hypothetical protein Q8A67_017362 [Cirrhinus molitorella]
MTTKRLPIAMLYCERSDFLLGFPALPPQRLQQMRTVSPAAIWSALLEQISSKRAAVLFQMQHCGCALCLGAAHAEAALNDTECPHCEDMSLASIRLWAALFSERDPASCALPLFFLKEKAAGQRTSALGCE